MASVSTSATEPIEDTVIYTCLLRSVDVQRQSLTGLEPLNILVEQNGHISDGTFAEAGLRLQEVKSTFDPINLMAGESFSYLSTSPDDPARMAFISGDLRTDPAWMLLVEPNVDPERNGPGQFRGTLSKVGSVSDQVPWFIGTCMQYQLEDPAENIRAFDALNDKVVAMLEARKRQ